MSRALFSFYSFLLEFLQSSLVLPRKGPCVWPQQQWAECVLKNASQPSPPSKGRKRPGCTGDVTPEGMVTVCHFLLPPDTVLVHVTWWPPLYGIPVAHFSLFSALVDPAYRLSLRVSGEDDCASDFRSINTKALANSLGEIRKVRSKRLESMRSCGYRCKWSTKVRMMAELTCVSCFRNDSSMMISNNLIVVWVWGNRRSVAFSVRRDALQGR